MSICPKDFKPCCDDVCHGAGCMRTGTPMLDRCAECGHYTDHEHIYCECPPDYFDDDGFEYGFDHD